MMTKREIVIAALQHKETEHVPYHVDFTEQEYEKVAEFLNDKNFMDNQMDALSLKKRPDLSF